MPLTLLENGKPIAKVSTKQIDVVQIKITSPQVLKGDKSVMQGNLKLMAVTFKKGPFLVGTPADGGVRTPDETVVLMKESKSSTLVMPPKSPVADAVKNQIVTGIYPVNLPGLYWFATVTLNAVNANDLGKVHIGFIQHVTISQLHGEYQNGKMLKSPLEGKTFLDLGDNADNTSTTLRVHATPRGSDPET